MPGTRESAKTTIKAKGNMYFPFINPRILRQDLMTSRVVCTPLSNASRKYRRSAEIAVRSNFRRLAGLGKQGSHRDSRLAADRNVRAPVAVLCASRVNWGCLYPIFVGVFGKARMFYGQKGCNHYGSDSWIRPRHGGRVCAPGPH